jgi:hypothetical protein
MTNGTAEPLNKPQMLERGPLTVWRRAIHLTAVYAARQLLPWRQQGPKLGAGRPRMAGRQALHGTLFSCTPASSRNACREDLRVRHDVQATSGPLERARSGPTAPPLSCAGCALTGASCWRNCRPVRRPKRFQGLVLFWWRARSGGPGPPPGGFGRALCTRPNPIRRVTCRIPAGRCTPPP